MTPTPLRSPTATDGVLESALRGRGDLAMSQPVRPQHSLFTPRFRALWKERSRARRKIHANRPFAVLPSAPARARGILGSVFCRPPSSGCSPLESHHLALDILFIFVVYT
ncbi:connectin-like [Ixodes scapularis]